jgi:S-methylmethionine-dependent homocysteine/selenocysteine methylase
MAKYRHALPQLGGDLFVTDGGIETCLIFHDCLELPLFAAFHLLREKSGMEALRRYYRRYAAIAESNGAGFVFESPTWRASPDWGHKLGYSAAALAEANQRSIALGCELRQAVGEAMPVVISGCVGPRGDGYSPARLMAADEAEAYHARQIETFAASEADMVTAITMTDVGEAVGVARAARAAGMPVAISFTLETDGRLPTGQELGEAIGAVDDTTDVAPAYYMINCAHPTHFSAMLEAGGDWVGRLRGVRANASRRSHAELDEATDLDDGDPDELGREYAALRRRLPGLTVLGGCCGTDHRHVEAICRACR